MNSANIRLANKEYVLCKGNCPYRSCLLHSGILDKETFVCKYGKIVCFCKTYTEALKKIKENQHYDIQTT